MAVIKLVVDHNVKSSSVCGRIAEILTNHDNPRVDISVLFDVKSTFGHYHQSFEEIYFVLDGWLTVQYCEPNSEKVLSLTLKSNELIVFEPGTHHRIVDASDKNRLCVVCIPGFNAQDEHLSELV